MPTVEHSTASPKNPVQRHWSWECVEHCVEATAMSVPFTGQLWLLHTQITLWKGSSPRKSHVRMIRKTPVTSVKVSKGATIQVRNTGPRPVRKGGLESASPPPKLMLFSPGYTNATPTVLAAVRRGSMRVCNYVCSRYRAWLALRQC